MLIEVFRQALAALLCSLLLNGVFAAPTVDSPARNDLSQDIVSAGQWRMQALRLSKLYWQVSLGINAAQAERQIGQGLSGAEAAIRRLEKYGKRAATQRSFSRCESVWGEIKVALAARPFSAEAAGRVGALADELAIHTGKLAIQVEAEATTPVGRLLDLSSRMNMLAQRLARLYLQALGGDRSEGRLVDLAQTRKEFLGALAELERAPENTAAAREGLLLLKNQWLFFDNALAQLQQAKGGGKAPQFAASSSERMAEVLDALGHLYAQDEGLQGLRSVR